MTFENRDQSNSARSAFAGRRAVKYLGQYKPLSPYRLPDGLVIVPAGSEMAEIGRGAQLRANVSYLANDCELSDADLVAAHRKWLPFDSFVMGDRWPIHHFDSLASGQLVSVPEVTEAAIAGEMYQLDYDDISKPLSRLDVAAFSSSKPISYRELYAHYLMLDTDLVDAIEWAGCAPYTAGGRRTDAFFNPNFGRLMHSVILMQRIIGNAPDCPEEHPACPKCGTKPYHPHHSVSRRKWLQVTLKSMIADASVAAEYKTIIEKAYAVRNTIAHEPAFDRSEMPEIAPGEMHEYGVDRAVKEYRHDNAALQSLIHSADTIARNLLLKKAFGIDHWSKLRPLKVTAVQVGGTRQ